MFNIFNGGCKENIIRKRPRTGLIRKAFIEWKKSPFMKDADILKSNDPEYIIFQEFGNVFRIHLQNTNEKLNRSSNNVGIFLNIKYYLFYLCIIFYYELFL